MVLSLLEARRRASGRLEDHDHLWLTVDSTQQATRTSVARHKAQRFRSVLGDGPVIDLCCGIGSDAMALAEGGAVILVDHDPVRLELARANLERTNSPPWALCADACALPLPALPLHIDPDRRKGTQRRHRYDQMDPAPGVLEDLMNRHVDMA
ncbi:MAG: class I SAM-dependent methyltransferase, partial [Planctomycetota bacterium]|nr:class I SAM-dependent methyltransferase [Planctomycetota bacterium]